MLFIPSVLWEFLFIKLVKRTRIWTERGASKKLTILTFPLAELPYYYIILVIIKFMASFESIKVKKYGLNMK